MAELHARGLASVLAADAQLDVGLDRAALLHGDCDQLPHPGLVELLEGVALEKIGAQVVGEELAFGVVAGEAQGHLGEVVGAEAEEVGLTGDLVGGQGGPRHLDHGADRVVDDNPALLEHRRRPCRR